MSFQWRAATTTDIDFARQLTCANMLPYYLRHDLLWQDEAFDLAWIIRQNWLICREDRVLGFVSLSRDARALYIRELQIAPAFRGQGAGTWAIGQAWDMVALERRPALRLTVFKDNPARKLYERMGLYVAGEDECFLRMQRDAEA
ncbi:MULTISPECIES: N-acetyltransferase [unclassified Pseudomonas]|uniref:GNAT family N-acetyltransferase n=1 Tax=unclassified Pseudomonas TaxID=196821 RepID=UPI00119C5FCD|nr:MULTISPECIES: GNAT family N-acetyltransferase [unclassified Pseudomonas]TWC18485.1 ribosomal protein S18 acetylase RimI-like enzyme [Pseudomonas sp. SJZ075]TWC23490.1 ribosomal protein S18 acetylase RimI-like enzyme [Pseudomonas sp. SJZ074]TWC34744.1 ribosomal protein S18 acetylase RimI-like enzyme [Pseudomonas sp. SJZ078]TWC40563.1 ribosomal protein S18 acetylase RimI-like enzyme [Pseudomonas sp. SJZ085]TWC55510.1 ribosomal protein S18 acetylase RimI-like enzyme [Pseudomonas sp. SJZ124]